MDARRRAIKTKQNKETRERGRKRHVSQRQCVPNTAYSTHGRRINLKPPERDQDQEWD